MSDLDALRFPIGPFQPRSGITEEEREGFINDIARFPAEFRAAVEGLSEMQLNSPYREGGWTIRQVVHHVPDSHLQGYVRFKLAMTEDSPSIKTYEQAAWGETEDSRAAPVNLSLDLLDSLHSRWTFFLRSLSKEDLARSYRHPEMGKITLETTVQLYAWHGKHHLGHVKLVAESE
jgi:uncharacterized damage-inducible protein DinB